MTEDTEYKKLPIEERCVHKMWKARVDGYEEAAKIFVEIDDEKSPEWNKFIGLIKKMVVDSNVVAQEKGLEAALIFVENCGHAGKTVGDVMSGIVQKCIAAPKARTKELAVQIALMYIEIEKHEQTIEELSKGMEHKNPKIVAACVSTVNIALRDFGSKVISVKPLIKKLAPLMSDRDKAVRDEGKLLAVEIYRWIGAAMKPQIASLPQVTTAELESEFDKLKGEKAEPIRYLKSQQEKQQTNLAAALADSEDNASDYMEGGNDEIDPMDLIDPVDILSKMPKDFFDKLEHKAWAVRKESLVALEKLVTENPKLESGDYGNVVLALKKVIAKDTNVVLVAMAGKCLALLAKGLGKKFSTYALACISAILDKFKEKKANVVTALREAIDAIYPSTNMEAILDNVIESLNNKNPSVKSETASFLARAFTRTQPTTLNKKLLKALVTSLLKTLNEPDPAVRDSSADAIGTLLKLMGEKAIICYLTDVDPLKMAKIKEFQDKAVITVKGVVIKKDRPTTAPVKTQVIKGGSVEVKPVTRPTTAIGTKKTAVKKPLPGNGGSATSSGSSVQSKSPNTQKTVAAERELGSEEIAAKAEELLSAEILTGLSDSNWKERLNAVESLMNLITTFDQKLPGISQILIRTISGRKPGLKEVNFQVLKMKLDIIRMVAENYPFTITTADFVINEIFEKLADAKNGTTAASVLYTFAEVTKLELIVSRILAFAFEQKSPKVQSESVNWISQAIQEFGFQINPKVLLEGIKKGIQSNNPTVRGATISLIGVLSMYMGSNILMYFDSEKAAVKSQIQAEIDKYAGKKMSAPTRCVKKSSDGGTGQQSDGEDEEEVVQDTINITDLLPRIDISSQISESLLTEISDKDWKTRNEGLSKLQNILNEAKLIKPSIGDLPPALAQRLVDSNAKIAQTTIAICEQLATAMGPACKVHITTLFPGFLHGLGDNKAFIRSASLTCINVWGEQCGYKEFFTGEMIADALKTGSPALKTEVWAWLAERLPTIKPKTISREELISLLPHLFANISDRNVDVRKHANEAVLGMMIHLSYEAMLKASDKQKQSSKKDIQVALDKARPNLPIKPLPKGKQQAPIVEEPKVVKSGGPKTQKQPERQAKVGEKTTTNRKKEEEVDTSPLLAINNLKSQRIIDEQKLRVLKWTFTTPREEFIDLLREQMTAANVNKGLMANMFHDDFRYHLKVIEMLIEDLPNNTKALACNLDLILKWLSLRFYDTNPSVLLKGLEYLNMVFHSLAEIEYIMAENEGSSFIPHLITKIGDPKDTVRYGVRTLLRQIVLVYSFTKVFSFLMEGLKSKNARQRTECLDELGYLIQTYGLNVCQPSQQVALKEVARHISDRDNSVRNAALNCIICAYFLIGDRVYKLIGQLTEKDLSMLDERIKRAKKTKKSTPPLESVKVVSQANNAPAVVRQDSIEIEDPVPNTNDELPPVEEQQSPVAQRTFDQPVISNNHVKPSGPFGLDPNTMAEIEMGWVRVDDMKQYDPPTIDLSSLYEPIKILPTRDGVQYPPDRFEQLLARSKNMMQNSTPISSKSQTYNTYNTNGQQIQQVSPRACPTSSPVNLAETLPPKLDPNMVKIIKAIGNPDSITARAALIEITDIIDSQDKQAVLRDYEELFIQSVLAQFKNLSQQPLVDSVIMYQPLLSITYNFFNSKTLGRTLTIPCLKNTMSVLLGLMADQKLNNGDDSQYTKVINGICLKILDKANFTNLNCALIRLLKETCPRAGLPKYTDLLMKCIWRNVKTMSERSNELDYDAVLYEVHDFMLALPTTWWLQRPSDTPLRTIKTIIHNMAKIKGKAILEHLKTIPMQSELHAYVYKILKNIQNEGVPPGASPQRSASSKDIQSKRISNQFHETISQIFKMISDKETSQQGFLKLYEFKRDNPDIDISTFLKGACANFQKYLEDGLAEIERTHGHSQQHTSNIDNRYGASANFQKYIENGLAEIERTHGSGQSQHATTKPTTNDNKYETNMQQPSTGSTLTASEVDKSSPEFWMGRLNHLRARANIGPNRNIEMDGNMLDNKVADENLNVHQTAPKASLIRKDKPELSPNRLQHIQAKLAQIKQRQN